MKTHDMREKLKSKYNSGLQWATVSEVRSNTGWSRNQRTCDFLAMGCWPSKGLHLHGHEIKVSRSDWLKEIQDVTKAGAFMGYCHYWWVVAPKGVVKLDELPATWGLMQCTEKTSLRVARPATLNESAAMDFEFFAACLRSYQDTSPVEKHERLIRDKAFSDGVAAAEKRQKAIISTDLTRAEQEARYWKEAVATFEESSGVKITKYGADDIGKAVKLVLDARVSPESVAEKIRQAICDTQKLESMLNGIS